MRKFKKDKLKVEIYNNRADMGAAAAEAATQKINEILGKKDFINIVFAAAPSQNEFLAELRLKNIPWDRVNAFHMDEYIGLDNSATQLFGNFLKERLFDSVNCRKVFYINGNVKDIEAECKRYTSLLEQYPTDIVFLGIGENTHVAFNDPHAADFNDIETVKVVDLDEMNRKQQVDPNDPSCFKTIRQVPTHAITLTVPALFKATHAYAIVPGVKKADAIYYTINSEVSERYPSTIFRVHPDATLFIDENSASKLAVEK